MISIEEQNQHPNSDYNEDDSSSSTESLSSLEDLNANYIDSPETQDQEKPLIYMDDDSLKLNEKIEERIRSLQKTMVSLKRELSEEKELWRKEVDEILQQQNSRCDCEHCIPVGTEPVMNELTIMDYEHKLSQYQKALAAAQAEKRLQLRRQMAANTYKRRLLEVENMCNMELLRVKQSVQYLQPLQQLVTHWGRENQDAGDTFRYTLDTINSMKPLIDEPKHDLCSRSELIFPPMECIGSRLYSDINDITIRNSNPQNKGHNSFTSDLMSSEDGSLLTLDSLPPQNIWNENDNQ